MKYFSLTV